MQYIVHLMPENVFLLYANTCAPWSLQTPKEMMKVFQLQKTPLSCRWSIKCLWFDRYYMVLHLTSWRVRQTRREKESERQMCENFSKSSFRASVRTQQLSAARGYRRLHSIYRTTSGSGPASISSWKAGSAWATWSPSMTRWQVQWVRKGCRCCPPGL